jgi:hypothetical protein
MLAVILAIQFQQVERIEEYPVIARTGIKCLFLSPSVKPFTGRRCSFVAGYSARATTLGMEAVMNMNKVDDPSNTRTLYVLIVGVFGAVLTSAVLFTYYFASFSA